LDKLGVSDPGSGVGVEVVAQAAQGGGDLGNHLASGLLMGFGGVTALGCSIGQGVTGLSLLSAGSCLAMAGIVAGTWAALQWQSWRLGKA
jgi:hypothetical protein